LKNASSWCALLLLCSIAVVGTYAHLAHHNGYSHGGNNHYYYDDAASSFDETYVNNNEAADSLTYFDDDEDSVTGFSLYNGNYYQQELPLKIQQIQLRIGQDYVPCC